MSSKVTDFTEIISVCNFLLVINSKSNPVLHLFWRYDDLKRSKTAPIPVPLNISLIVTHFNSKTRVSELSVTEVSMILALVVFDSIPVYVTKQKQTGRHSVCNYYKAKLSLKLCSWAVATHHLKTCFLRLPWNVIIPTWVTPRYIWLPFWSCSTSITTRTHIHTSIICTYRVCE